MDVFQRAEIVSMRAGGLDRRAFDEAFAAVRPRLVGLCRGLVGIDLADDVVNDTYLRGLSHIHQLKNPAVLEAWLTRIAINLSFNEQRSRRKLARIETQAAEETTPIRDIGLRQLIELLSPRARTVIVLHYGYGYGTPEIAELLDISPVNARTILHRARIKLGEELRKAEHG